MKLIYIANIRLPTEKAHGIQIMKMCEAFANIKSVNVDLVVPSRTNNLTEDPFTYYGVARVFSLAMLRVPDWVRFGRIGFMCSLLIFSERTRWLRYFWTAEVVYSRDALVLLQYILLGRRLVFEVHAKPSRISRFVARRAYRVIVISEALRTAYITAGVESGKILVAPDAVDTHFFDCGLSRTAVREILGISHNARIVAYVGHLYSRKGTEVLARAATLLPEEQFFFVGGIADDIARFRALWGNQPNIHIVGHVLPIRVPLYLRAADVLVIPNSAKDYDAKHFTSPMKLFEYMASGTPIVASDVPSIREVIGEQHAKFFIPDDPKSLCDAIIKALDNYGDAKKKAAASLALAENYSWQKRAQNILGFISN